MKHLANKKKVQTNSISDHCGDTIHLKHVLKSFGKRLSNSFGFTTEFNDKYPKIEE